MWFALALGTTACSAPDSRPTDKRFACMGTELLDSLYSRYGVDGEPLLRETYPYDDAYKAGYLAGDDGAKGNPYSYLWPFSGTLSAVSALWEATGDSALLGVIYDRVLPGLDRYADTVRTPFAYASYVNDAPPSDRFYDDNIWLGIDFADLYRSTGDSLWLDKAEEIWRFIESGTDSVLGGGIYWCEQKKRSKNTCSNAPASVLALKLFAATADSAYLDKGKALYHWTQNNLQDSVDGLYFDNVNLEGRIGRAKFAYNTGQMIQSGALLYRQTGDSSYLREAERVADAAYGHFFNGGEGADSTGTYQRISPGDIWFTAVMMRGFAELEDINGDSRYMDAFCRNLNFARHNMRDPETGLYNRDWTGVKTDEKKWLLTQAAFCEMLARAAIYYNKSN